MNPPFENERPLPFRGVLVARLVLVLAASLALHAGAAPSGATPPEGAGAKSTGDSASAPYFKRSQLDARPYLVTKVDPVYPPGVPPTGGKVRMRLFINERGMVDRIEVVEAKPPVKFDEAAVTAFRGAQFEPGKRKGTPVKSQIQIEMDFAPLLPTRGK